MLFFLKGYKGAFEIKKVARSKDVCDDLLHSGLEVLSIYGDEASFLPQGETFKLTSQELQQMEPLYDYDIVEINEQGIGHRLYSEYEGDTTIVTTSSCNSNCVMCPAGDNERKNVGSNPLIYMERFVEYLPSNLYYLVVTGGEPTLAKENFLAIMQQIKNKFLLTKILLLTNGRSLSNVEFFHEFCAVAPRHIRIAVPIHGHVAELHDSITQAPGSFYQTLKGISNMLDAHMEVELRIIVSKLNCEYLNLIAGFIADNFKGITCVNFVGLEVRGNCAKNANQVYIDYHSAAQRIIPAADILISEGIDVGIYNYPLCLLDKRYWPIAEKSISSYKSKYYEECNECEVKESCCGIFQATMNFIKPAVFPIRLQEIRADQK